MYQSIRTVSIWRSWSRKRGREVALKILVRTKEHEIKETSCWLSHGFTSQLQRQTPSEHPVSATPQSSMLCLHIEHFPAAAPQAERPIVQLVGSALQRCLSEYCLKLNELRPIPTSPPLPLPGAMVSAMRDNYYHPSTSRYLVPANTHISHILKNFYFCIFLYQFTNILLFFTVLHFRQRKWEETVKNCAKYEHTISN